MVRKVLAEIERCLHTLTNAGDALALEEPQHGFRLYSIMVLKPY